MATQKQRSDATRAILLQAFRASFLKNGLEATTTQAVLDQTGLSKGAMYHHFQSKTDIVEAIYSEESQGAIERAFKKGAQSGGPLAQIKAACLAWTEEVQVPSVSKILFEIGPKALGPERAKAIEDAHSLQRIEGLLRAAIAQGDMVETDPKLIATFLNALVAETAMHHLRTGQMALDVLDRSIDALFQAWQR